MYNTHEFNINIEYTFLSKKSVRILLTYMFQIQYLIGFYNAGLNRKTNKNIQPLLFPDTTKRLCN